ncbi:MAG: caspase family protein [Planctomycetaceae bacterium]|nr:caspase family protein [Planctomycetaceae bacterium]
MTTIFVALFPLTTFAESVSSGRLNVIIIAASYLQSTTPEITKLPYTQNDAKFILEALNRQSASTVKHRSLLEESEKQPTKANIETLIVQWLRECEANDTVLIFFSGHGIARDDKGQVNALVPSDFDANDIAGSSIPVSWLRRQLGQCEAKTKFLLLDCCHAGGEGISDSEHNGVMKHVAQQDTLDVVTIASCGSNEKSHYWKDQHLSLFSYYLAEALRGEADVNHDQKITANELYSYIHDHVRKTAENLGFQQNPVRIIRSGVSGDPVLVRLGQPLQTLDQLLKDIAQKISARMQEKNITMTGTLPFLSLSQSETITVGPAEFGLLPGNCTEKLEQHLSSFLPNGYISVRHQMMTSTLAEHGLRVEEVYSGKMEQAIGTTKFVDTKKIRSFIVGKISRTSQEGVVEISCELTGLPNITALGTFAGRVQLSQAEIAEMGRSMQAPQPAVATNKITAIALPNSVDPEYRPRLTETENNNSVTSSTTMSVSTNSVTTDSSLSLVPFDASTSSLFRVTIVVKRGNNFIPVKPIQQENRTYLPLERGDVYRIRIYNPTSETVMTRVLVDGLNTLPEKIEEPDKVKFVAVTTTDLMQHIESLKKVGAIIVQNTAQEFFRVAAPSGLDRARPWVVRPHKEVEIPGFFHNVGLQGGYKEFRVTESSFSVGGQTNFIDQLGLITVGCFTAIPKNLPDDSVLERRVGTGMGYRYRQNVVVNEDLIIGGLLETQQYYYAPRKDIVPNISHP